MKKNFIILCQWSFFCWLFLHSVLFAQSIQLDKVIITVDKEVITQNELFFLFSQIEKERKVVLSEKEKAELINDLILELLLVAESKQLAVEISNQDVNRVLFSFQESNNLSYRELEKMVQNWGMDIQYFRGQLRKKQIGEVMLRRLRSSIEPTSKEIQELYKKSYSPKTFYEIGILFKKGTSKNSLAEIVMLKKLAKNNNFKEIILQNSDDPFVQQNQGLLPATTLEDMLPEFAKAVDKLSIGEISEPTKTNNGYYLVQLEKKIERYPVEIDSVRTSLENELYRSKYQKTLEAYIVHLRSKYHVFIKVPIILQLLKKYGYSFS